MDALQSGPDAGGPDRRTRDRRCYGSKALLHSLNSNRTGSLLKGLKIAGVDMTAQRKDTGGPEPLDGLTFVLTGTLERYTRSEAARKIIEGLGGKVSFKRQQEHPVTCWPAKTPAASWTGRNKLGVKRN
jgi:DNA ligase (NAD+)